MPTSNLSEDMMMGFNLTLRRLSAGLVLMVWAGLAQAQLSPVGLWHTIDDNTGKPKGEVRIVDVGGVLSGRVERSLENDPNAKERCDDCTDERKGKPIIGMEIIRGARKVDGKNVWEGGKILDPENGKEYTLRLTPIEGGKKLEVRGYIAFFYRNQIWERAQ